jgi:hypothetical protein
MASEATAKRGTEKPESAPSPSSPTPVAEVPLFAPLRDLDKRGRILLGALILLANLPLIHYAFRHGLREMPTTTTVPFADDFNRDDVGPNYWSTGGDWRIEGGELHAPGTRNNPLWLQAALPHDVAIDFDVRRVSAEGELKFDLFGDGFNLYSGYEFVMGAGNNQITSISRLATFGGMGGGQAAGVVFNAQGVGVPGPASDTAQNAINGRSIADLYANHTLGPSSQWRVQRNDLRVQQNAPYHMHLERRGGDLKWYANDQLVLELNDPAPLAGKGHDRFAFSAWEGDLFFDNLAIRPL